MDSKSANETEERKTGPARFAMLTRAKDERTGFPSRVITRFSFASMNALIDLHVLQLWDRGELFNSAAIDRTPLRGLIEFSPLFSTRFNSSSTFDSQVGGGGGRERVWANL